MRLKALLYRVNHRQVLREEFQEEEATLLSIYGHLCRMDIQMGMGRVPYFGEQHRNFAAELRAKIEQLFGYNLQSERDIPQLDESREAILNSFVMRSCLKVHIAKKNVKMLSLITQLDDIQERILLSIDSDSSNAKSGFRVVYSFSNMYLEQRTKLLECLEKIRSNIKFIYGLRDLTNMDLDYLHDSVENIINEFRRQVSSLYNDGINPAEKSLCVDSYKINNMPAATNLFFYQDFPRFLHTVKNNVHFRFDPLLMEKNRGNILAQKNLPAEFSVVLNKGKRREDDDFTVTNHTVQINNRQVAYLSSGRGDRNIQEDRVNVVWYQVDKSIKPEQIADLMYEAIQHHADIHANSFHVGSTLNWTATYDGFVINANIGDSKSFLVKRTLQSNVEGDIEELITVEALNWEHKPTHTTEIDRFHRLGVKVNTQNHRIDEVGLNMSRAIGDHSYHHKGLNAEPDFTITEVQNGQESYVLSVSDGVLHTMSRKDIEAFLNSRGNLEGDVANDIRREAYLRYTVSENTHKQILPADNISVAFAPVIHDDQQLVISCVHDGHSGEYVANAIHNNFEKYLLEAAHLHQHRLIPGHMGVELREAVERNILEQLDDTIQLARQNYNDPLKKSLKKFKRKVQNSIGSKGRLTDVNSYQHSDVIHLVNCVIDSVNAAYSDEITLDEKQHTHDELKRAITLTSNQNLGRTALIVAAVLIGMIAALACVLILNEGSFLLSATPHMQHIMSAGISTVGGGITSGLVLLGIFVTPKDRRRRIGYQILDSLPKNEVSHLNINS